MVMGIIVVGFIMVMMVVMVVLMVLVVIMGPLAGTVAQFLEDR